MQYATITKDHAPAAAAIAAGRVAAVPTGTSYALVADALQGHALQRVKHLKGRSPEKPFSVFLAAEKWDEFLQLTEQERRVLQALAGQPLTLLVTPAPDLVHLAHHDRVALRQIDRPEMAALAQALVRPLTATSANKSGQPACRTPRCIVENFPGKLDETTYDLSLAVILDAGELPKKPPTTIAKLENGTVSILRQGELTAADITAHL